MTIGIVAALPFEAAGLAARDARSAMPGDSLLVNVAGIGSGAALAAARRLLSQGAQALVSWGSAGALQASLCSGDLVLAECVRSEAGAEYGVDARWRQQLGDALAPGMRVWHGALLEVSEVVCDPQRKRHLAERHGAIAIDMESAALAHLAADEGVPFLTVRSICDTLDMRLPFCIRTAIQGDGSMAWGRLLTSLARHPADWPAARESWKGMRRAKRTLGQVAKVPCLACPLDGEQSRSR